MEKLPQIIAKRPYDSWHINFLSLKQILFQHPHIYQNMSVSLILWMNNLGFYYLLGFKEKSKINSRCPSWCIFCIFFSWVSQKVFLRLMFTIWIKKQTFLVSLPSKDDLVLKFVSKCFTNFHLFIQIWFHLKMALKTLYICPKIFHTM